ncbi:protein maelstrom [Drosophila montana]|uniref:protein maelstrom n=1 Tax=Drosophila montana TaxID=40370 RepID=UPI00313E9A9E
MAPKKHNGFMMFVQEWRKNDSEGRKMSMPQAVSKCGELWKRMNAQQRGPYNGSAKDADVVTRCKVERMNCHGQALSAVQREEREAADRQMVMKRKIERMVLDGKAQHDLENTKFIFAAFNYFTKAITNDIYIPAEFAACEFALKSGKTSLYSSHINPGQLIFGQGSDTQHHTSNTHQLPLPPNALGEADIGRLYVSIVEYLRGCQDGAGHPNDPLVVFTSSELVPVVRGCFRYLESDCDEVQENIEVYDIQYLFYVLKKEVMDIADLPNEHINKSITDNLFVNDFFEYHSGISCQFHEDNDRGKYCTQSKVARWCYLFSDYMCGDLAIKPLPGKHMPPRQEPKFRVINPEEPSENSSFSRMTRSEKSSGNTSFASISSLQTEVKHEIVDHSAFSANLNASDDFPTLGGRRGKRNAEPLAKSFATRDAKGVWNVPATNCSVKDLGDAFNMPRR